MISVLSAADVAKKWGISKRRVALLCKEGRIPGAKIVGNAWMIPEDAEKPKDPRVIRREQKNLKEKNRGK